MVLALALAFLASLRCSLLGVLLKKIKVVSLSQAEFGGTGEASVLMVFLSRSPRSGWNTCLDSLSKSLLSTFCMHALGPSPVLGGG